MSSTATFCNSISIMPFLILEKTCEQQAYRKAYWPSPNDVYFPVRVYSSTLSGTHRCPPRMTSRASDIVSVPEWLSLYSLLFANFIFIVKFLLDFVAGYVQYVSLLATGHIMQHNIHFLFSFTSSQPACLWGEKTLAEILEWLLQCLHEFMWLL